MADALLAQSAIDRLQSAAYELVLDGESYRKHQKPGLDVGTTTPAGQPDGGAGLDRLHASGHHRHADAADPRGGPFTLTEGWSHQRGGRQDSMV